MKLSDKVRDAARSLSKWDRHQLQVDLMHGAAKELDRREARIKRLEEQIKSLRDRLYKD